MSKPYSSRQAADQKLRSKKQQIKLQTAANQVVLQWAPLYLTVASYSITSQASKLQKGAACAILKLVYSKMVEKYEFGKELSQITYTAYTTGQMLFVSQLIQPTVYQITSLRRTHSEPNKNSTTPHICQNRSYQSSKNSVTQLLSEIYQQPLERELASTKYR